MSVKRNMMMRSSGTLSISKQSTRNSPGYFPPSIDQQKTLNFFLKTLKTNKKFFLHSKTQFTSDITSKFGYSAILPSLHVLLSKAQLTSYISKTQFTSYITMTASSDTAKWQARYINTRRL